MAKKISNQHPYVFVHGMMGWGEAKKLYKVLPYWGMVTGNYAKHIRKMGYEAYVPSVAPMGSAWDRACELYAQIMGTTVDYGIAHSKKYGHARYGMTFSAPLIPDWTPERSIHLFGHSFGGPTIRMFLELLTNGSEEERAVTPADELSPLFKGGQGDLVKSLTAVAGPFDGITFPHVFPFLVNKVMMYGILSVASVMGNVGTGHIYDFKMSAWGITAEEDAPRSARNMFNIKAMRHFANAKDNVFADVHMDRAAELNKMISTPQNQYLFAVTGNGTKQNEEGNWVRDSIMFPLFTIFANRLGKWTKPVAGIEITEEWRMNDGIVSVASAIHPITQPHCEFDDVRDKPIKKGIWHALPLAWGDHGTVIGGSLSFIGFGKKRPYITAYDYWIDFLLKLPD